MTSGFLSIHPAVGFIYFVGAIMLFTLIKHPLYLVSFLIINILWLLLLGEGHTLGKNVRFYGFMVLIILILNPLFNNEGTTILFYLANRSITLEAILYGIDFALSLLNVLLSFMAYNLIISPQKFLYLFANLIPRTAFILSITMRFIPLFSRRSKEILEIAPKEKKRLAYAMNALNTLVSWTLEESLENAASMRARGYGSHKRTSATRFLFDSRDRWSLSVLLFSLILILIGFFLGFGHFEFFPELSSFSLTPYTLIHYLLCLLFVSLPLLIEMREYARWHLMK